MTEFDNIKKLNVSEADRNDLICVTKGLTLLRKDRNETNKYYDNYLSSDKHMVNYDYWCD